MPGELTPASCAETTATAPSDPLIGAVLGEYRLTRRLGEGGMGVVYAGLQPVIQKPVAVKILQALAGRAGEVDQLIAEARAANAVRHRGIVDVFGFGTLPDGRPYIVMDLLEGEPLDAIVAREAPLSIDRVLAILDDVLDTLSAAHAAGVIHRDLKPANLFLVREAHGGSYVRILDFGLAKRLELGADGIRSSKIAGTPHYMAPEQALGRTVGPQSDLYAVGCLAYEMLTGVLPFTATNPIEQMTQRISEAPRRASEVARVPPELDRIVMQMLARDPAERPASAAVVRQQIAKYRRVLQSESTVSGWVPPKPSSARAGAVSPRPETVKLEPDSARTLLNAPAVSAPPETIPAPQTGSVHSGPDEEATPPWPDEAPPPQLDSTRAVPSAQAIPSRRENGFTEGRTARSSVWIIALAAACAVAVLAVAGALLVRRHTDSVATASIPESAPSGVRSDTAAPLKPASAEASPSAPPTRADPPAKDGDSKAAPLAQDSAALPVTSSASKGRAPVKPPGSDPADLERLRRQLSEQIDRMEKQSPSNKALLSVLAKARSKLAAAKSQQDLNRVKRFLDDYT